MESFLVWIETAFEWVVKVSLQSSVLIVLIIGIQILLR